MQREQTRLGATISGRSFKNDPTRQESGAIITHDPLPNVQAARGQMIRLFQNLIGNSIKFRKPDESPRIHISAEEHGKEWMIWVQDNGIGFEQSHAQHLFAPFKRLHPRHKYPGTGIGLAACKRIVERYAAASVSNRN